MKVMDMVQKVWKSLSSKQRRTLNSDAMRHVDAEYLMRCKIVRNLVRGNLPAEIHKHLGCSVSQVYRVAHRFVDEGPMGLADRREDNGEAKVDDAIEWTVLLAVVGTPQDFGYRRPTWTQELLVRVVAQVHQVSLSTTTMSRLLRRLDVRLGRPKPMVGCPWPKRRKNRRLKQIERLVQSVPPGEVVLYADEVDIHLNPRIGPDWMLRGLQKQVLTPGQNEKRYLAGALDAHTGKLTWVVGERKNSDLFIKQLWQLVRRDYPKAKRIHLILDNVRIHKSQRTQLALDALQDRVSLHFLPPYCPDHNRIERVWEDLHDNVTRNHRCQSMEELMEEVHQYLLQRKHSLKHEYATAA